MKNLFSILLGCFAFALVSCGGDECQTCKGTVASVEYDITHCDNGDGTVTSTDNLTNAVSTDTLDYTAVVASQETLGLDCN